MVRYKENVERGSRRNGLSTLECRYAASLDFLFFDRKLFVRGRHGLSISMAWKINAGE